MDNIISTINSAAPVARGVYTRAMQRADFGSAAIKAADDFIGKVSAALGDELVFSLPDMDTHPKKIPARPRGYTLGVPANAVVGETYDIGGFNEIRAQLVCKVGCVGRYVLPGASKRAGDPGVLLLTCALGLVAQALAALGRAARAAHAAQNQARLSGDGAAAEEFRALQREANALVSEGSAVHAAVQAEAIAN